MKLKGFKKSDGSIAKIYTDPTLTESDSPADAASVKAKDDLLQHGITNNANYAAGLNTRLSELENGAPSIIAPKVTEWLNANVDPTGSAVTVDSSLTIAGSAADAKKTGDEISDLKSDLNYNHTAEPGYVLRSTNGGHGNEWAMVGTPTDAQAATAINAWLNEHPEATTTVQDYSLSEKKLIKGVLGFVTPSMFGAKGDGVTVDNVPLNECFDFCARNKVDFFGENKTYLIDDSTDSLCGHKGVVVNGGIRIQQAKFKLKSGCQDLTVPLACKYDDNPYVIKWCDFDGELRTPTSGIEDGGNHGIIFCDGNTMFPSDWQSFADVIIEDCNFTNIQSYGVFPTPIDNKLTVNRCSFECHGPAVLTYATEARIGNCSYKKLAGANTTVSSLAIDEIENFSSASERKKTIVIENCTSNFEVVHIQKLSQSKVLYGDIKLINCESDGVIFRSYSESADDLIEAGQVVIDNCYGGKNYTGTEDVFLIQRMKADLIVIENIRIGAKGFRCSDSQCNIKFKDCKITYPIHVYGSTFGLFQIENSSFFGTHTDGIITTRWGTIASAETVHISNCYTESQSHLLRNIDAKLVSVVGLSGKDLQVRLLMNDTATETNVFVVGLVMAVANAQYNYFIEKINGFAVIRGISAGIRTLSVSGGVVDETTAPPTT